jgi:hypothetical protein
MGRLVGNAAVHTLTHPSAKLSRPEAAEDDARSEEPTTSEPAAAPLVPEEHAAESLFAALAAEAGKGPVRARDLCCVPGTARWGSPALPVFVATLAWRACG